MRIKFGQNGSILLNSYPYDLHYDLKDILEISVGPRDNNDGIKACLTYNPPGAYKTGFQQERSVCLCIIICLYMGEKLSVSFSVKHTC